MSKLINLLIIFTFLTQIIYCDEKPFTINDDEEDITTFKFVKSEVTTIVSIDTDGGDRFGDDSFEKDKGKDIGKDEGKDIGKDEGKDVGKDEGKDIDIEKDKGIDEEIPVTKDEGSDEKVTEHGIANANELMDKILKYLKNEYGKSFDPLRIDKDLGPFKYGRWGNAKLHSGVIKGLSNIKRFGDILIKNTDNDVKSIFGNLQINDMLSFFKMDASIFNRIPIKNRELVFWAKNVILYVDLELNESLKKLSLSTIRVDSIVDFGVKSGRFFWPLNKIVDSIIKMNELHLKGVIKDMASKYMGNAIHDEEITKIISQHKFK